MTTPNRSAVVAFVDRLFVNGQGDIADRLVLTSPAGCNLGGWSRAALVHQITDWLSVTQPTPRARKRATHLRPPISVIAEHQTP